MGPNFDYPVVMAGPTPLQDAANALAEHPATAFEAEVTHVLCRFKAALAGVFASLPHQVRGGTDLQRELSLPSTLSWQLHRFATAGDPVAEAGQVPGRHAMTRALAAAEKLGVPKSIIERAASAFDEFEACVERHAGDRAAFTSMVSSIATSEASIDLNVRRDAFRALSRIYGVQLGARTQTYILHPTGRPNEYDIAFIAGYVNFRAMRPFERLFITRHGLSRDDWSSRHEAGETSETSPLIKGVTPVDLLSGEPDSGDVPLLHQFSSGVLPRFFSNRRPGKDRELYISCPPIGRTGETTFFIAERATCTIGDDEELNCDITSYHPARVQLMDILLPRSFFNGKTPQTGVYGGVQPEMRKQRRDPLNVQARTAFVGAGVESLHTPIIPRYVEMLSCVCDWLGWRREDFDAYRCQVEYPVLYTLLTARFEPGS